jgi:hypothetical protein
MRISGGDDFGQQVESISIQNLMPENLYKQKPEEEKS